MSYSIPKVGLYFITLQVAPQFADSWTTTLLMLKSTKVSNQDEPPVMQLAMYFRNNFTTLWFAHYLVYSSLTSLQSAEYLIPSSDVVIQKCNFCGLWMSETKETTGSASLRGIKHPGKQGNFLNPDKSVWFWATVLLKCETPFSFVWVEQEAVSAVLPQRRSNLPPLCWLISQQYILAWIRSHWYRPQNSFTVNLHLKHLFTSTLTWFTVNFTHGQLLETTNTGSGFRIHPYI